jgi:hypothetical protein
MKIRTAVSTAIASVMFTLPAWLFAARVNPDLQPPQKRQATVANAERIVQKKAPEPLPTDLVSPFNPTDFDRVEGAPATQGTPRPGTPAPVVTPPPPPGDRETLESLATQITPSGMMTLLSGKPVLVIGRKQFEVGTRFTATFNNQDYELELVAIDRTTFTLRYRGEEITRPIKLVR